MKRILSGVQPTGNMHLGNYLGALKQWVQMQQDYECLFCIVDLHALTIPSSQPHLLRKHTLDVAALYIAAGLNPETNIIFPQSAIPGHSELMWILSCHTPLGWLNRMTQFKEKSKNNSSHADLGLYSYPVLMAADILLYQATDVPVGDDQKQHIEMARDLAGSFNRFYGKDLFKIPEPRIIGHATRVMSLKDGTKKMSKSDPAEGSRIGLIDSPDVIFEKFKKAKTDAFPFPEAFDSLQDRPEIRNLITIYAALADITPSKVCELFGGQNFAPFKAALAELTIEVLDPLRQKFLALQQNPDYLTKILKKGQEDALEIGEKTLKEVQEAVGLLQLL
jgi:tryptophanyl-tRNA synthetase